MTEWLESAQLPIQPEPPDSQTVLAIRAWNLMEGSIDWQAMPAVTELLGIDDIEVLTAQLEAIRKHGRESGTD